MSASGDSTGVSRSRAILALAFALLVAVLVVVLNEPLDPPLVAMFVLTIGFFVASIFDAVRTHPMYDLVHAAWLSVILFIWYVEAESPLFLGGLVVLGILSTFVELYNYRHGTSYLRFDA